MFSYVKLPFLSLLVFLFFSCADTKKMLSYSVADIYSKNAREIEEMGNFNVHGTVEGKVNLGFIKAFKLCDSDNSQKCMYVISNHVTLPSPGTESVFKVRLYKEIAIIESEFIIFEEF
jgi:hypothetical protein